MTSARDLTPAELQELRASLRFADQLLAPTHDGLLAFDRDLRYLYWNAEMERITGRAAHTVLGACAFDVFPQLLHGPAHERCLAAVAGQSVRVGDQAYAIDATHAGMFEASYGPLRAADGRIVGGTVVIRDITEAKRAEQLLLETETRFRNMADVAPVLLWMSGSDGLCTFFNETWLRFTGRTLEEEWGVGWAEGVHHEDFQRSMDTYVAAFNARVTFEMEYRLRRADGEYRWILDRGSPRYTPNGTFAGFIGSCVDITDRKRLEFTLRTAVSNRDDFLAIASHELRTPLTSLQLSLGSLKRVLLKSPDEALKSGRLEQGIEAASSQSRRLTTLVSELLDISRITTGHFALEFEEFDLGALVRDVVARLDAAVLDSGSHVQVTSGAAPLVGFWDRSRLDRVVTNLLGNALKYGEGKPVTVRLEETDRKVVMVVRDAGIGIAPEDRARIFERFERAVPLRNFGGFGLGLWISREIVTALEGTISVASRPGEGATFTVELPRNRTPPQPFVDAAAAATPPTSAAPRRP